MARVVLVSADRSTPEGWASSLGDSMLTDMLAEAIDMRGHQVIAVDFGGRRVVPGEPRLQVSGIRGLANAIRRSDLVIVGGGTLLQDDVGSGWRGLPRLVAATSWLSRLLGRRCVFFGVGCEPGTRPLARGLLRAAVWRRTVWVREERSAVECAGLGCRDVRVAGDACLLGIGRLQLPQISSRKGVVVALARGDGSQLDWHVVERLRSEFGSLTFLRMDQRQGAGDGEDIASGSVPQVDGPLSWRQALEIIGSAELVIGSRMHALYMRLLTGGPMVALAGRRKVVTFAHEFGVPVADNIGMSLAVLSRQSDPEFALRVAAERVEKALDEMLLPLER